MLFKINKIIIIMLFLVSQYVVTILLRRCIVTFMCCNIYDYKLYYDYIIFTPWWLYHVIYGLSIALIVYYFIRKDDVLLSIMLIYSLLAVVIFIIILNCNILPFDPMWIWNV